MTRADFAMCAIALAVQQTLLIVFNADPTWFGVAFDLILAGVLVAWIEARP